MTSLFPGAAQATLRDVQRVTVAVPTYHRPEQLRELLSALVPHLADLADVLPHPDDAQILVVDNDAEGSARTVVTGVRDAAALGDRLRYAVESAPGVSAVRNRALRELRSDPGDLLVFIDDDEIPRDGWLLSLVRTWTASAAAAVSGPVIPTLRGSGTLEPWLVEGGFFAQKHRRGFATGTTLHRAATNNLLLELAVVRRLGLTFDLSLGLSGGEDSVFTSRLVDAGATIVWCAEAVVEDRLTAERLTRQSALSRARTAAHTRTLADLMSAPGRAQRTGVRLLVGVRGIARAAQGCAALAMFRVTGVDRHDAVGRRALARCRGELTAVLGRRSTAYAYGRTAELPPGE